MKVTSKEYVLRNKKTGEFAHLGSGNYLKMVPFKKATTWKRKATAEMWLKINTNRNTVNVSDYRKENKVDWPVPYNVKDLVIVEIKITREIQENKKDE
jgi:hypothetical protein